MKKISFPFLALAIFCLAACSKSSDSAVSSNSEETVPVSLCAAFSIGTKATGDGDGAAAYANQCRLQIIMKKNSGETVVYDKVKAVDVTSHKVDFDDIVLVKNQQYDLMFWADNKEGAYYNTDNLKAVTLNGNYVGCNDKRDAFFAAIADTTVTAAFSRTICLYRPFAQLNVITKDIDKISSQLPSGTELADLVPNKVALKFTAPDSFNVLTGEASGSRSFTYEAAVYTTQYKTAASSLNTLSMDYIYAPAGTQSVNLIGFTAKNDKPTGVMKDIELSFDNIPLQRNYRTNIIGDLLTNATDISVVIKPGWTDEINIDK